MGFTKLTPQGFAQLSTSEQTTYQIDEAKDIRNRMDERQGEDVTQAEIDFANRVLGVNDTGKNFGSAPDTGYFSNILASESAGFQQLGATLQKTASGIGSGIFSGIWPILLLLALALGIVFFVKVYRD